MSESQQGPQDEQQAQQPVSEETPSEEVPQSERTLGMLCHLLGLLTSFLGPLIIWLVKKDESAFVDDQGKEALNFQITVAIAGAVSGLLVPAGIGCLLVPLVSVGDIVLSIMATMQASKGVRYRYPVNIRFIK